MIKFIFTLAFGLFLLTQGQVITLNPKNFTLVNVKIEEVVYHSKNALRVMETGLPTESIAILKNFSFENGTIEAEVAGTTLPTANATARGFIGIAFRVSNIDSIRYDCFYLRPVNGRAEDQIRRNHAAQYIGHPFYTWQWLRKEFPSKYESYVDLVEGEWTKIKITVKGNQARIYVHNSDQPVLIVNELLNPESSGAVALWVGQGTDGYFRDLKIINE